MDERAVITKSYRRQLLLWSLMFLGGAGWFLYDGYVTYPYKRMVAQEYARFKEESRVEQWGEYARAKGWPDGTHGDPGYNHSDSDIFTQKLIGYGLLPLGVLFCYSLASSFRKWIKLENDGIATSWGQRMPFDSVKQLNKSRWKTKGIAVAHYDDGSKTKKLVLDDFKYTRNLIGDMLFAVESHLAPEQIVGGPPEPTESATQESQPPSTDS